MVRDLPFQGGLRVVNVWPGCRMDRGERDRSITGRLRCRLESWVVYWMSVDSRRPEVGLDEVRGLVV